MKLLITLLLIELIVIGGCSYNSQSGPVTEEEKCIEVGGSWRTFSNGCADSCEYDRDKENIFCTQAFIDSCECGVGRCWNEGDCEPI